MKPDLRRGSNSLNSDLAVTLNRNKTSKTFCIETFYAGNISYRKNLRTIKIKNVCYYFISSYSFFLYVFTSEALTYLLYSSFYVHLVSARFFKITLFFYYALQCTIMHSIALLCVIALCCRICIYLVRTNIFKNATGCPNKHDEFDIVFVIN